MGLRQRPRVFSYTQDSGTFNLLASSSGVMMSSACKASVGGDAPVVFVGSGLPVM
jgi:hypothetical protein